MLRDHRKSLVMGWALLVCAMLAIGAQADEIKPAAEDLRWMQTALDRWEVTCRRHLHLPVEPLAWIIFYDENHAWHLNAEKPLLPAHETATVTLSFAGKAYELLRVPHQQGLWAPGYDKGLPITELMMKAVPYAVDDMQKAFCFVPLPTLFHKHERIAKPVEMDEAYLGYAQHELTHTRQLPLMVGGLKRLSQIYRLPLNMDDNVVETTFGKDKTFTKQLHLEMDALGDAALADTTAECQRYLARALRMVQQRHARYFVGQRKMYAPLDEYHLTSEGTAMWAQFKMARDHAPVGEDVPTTFKKLITRYQWWVEAEGLALFLLIDQLVPNWQARYFAPNPPSPFTVLRATLQGQTPKNVGVKSRKQKRK